MYNYVFCFLMHNLGHLKGPFPMGITLKSCRNPQNYQIFGIHPKCSWKTTSTCTYINWSLWLWYMYVSTHAWLLHLQPTSSPKHQNFHRSYLQWITLFYRSCKVQLGWMYCRPKSKYTVHKYTTQILIKVSNITIILIKI